MIRTQSVSLFRGDQVGEWYVHREHSFPGVDPDGWHVAHSRLFVCPKCLQPWGMLHFLGESQTWPVGAFCEECNIKDDWHPVPGSLLLEEGWGVIDTALLAALPDHLVKREFDLHMEALAP